ncbi:MAG: MFS transporter [Desulfobacteraceae bacterium A6]|nr:MAG: MFS transporter [Desulfobacteraceae bacterium A6]
MNKAPVSVKAILASQYFLYFGIMGIFLPFFNLYCYKLGFTGFQIGVLSASRSVVMVLSPLLLGSLADRFHIRKPIYLSCHILSAAIWSFYLFTSDFWMMLIITVCYTVFYSPIISFLEAFTIDILGSRKKSYGSIRVWGTVAFIVTVFLLGKILDIYPIAIILPLILAGSVIHALFAIKIPDIKQKNNKPFLREAGALLKKRQVILFLSSAFLMLVSHGAYYGFFSIHLENIGYGRTFIGVAWAVASIAEILVMINSDRIFKRFSIKNVIIFSFITAVARWLTLSAVKSPALILLSQTFHAVTYGAFHISSILYIDSMTSDETKTLGQSLNNAVTYGLGLMVGFFASGWLYEKAGSPAIFALSSLIALAGGIIFMVFKFDGLVKSPSN